MEESFTNHPFIKLSQGKGEYHSVGYGIYEPPFTLPLTCIPPALSDLSPALPSP